jgi:hypothetical protein
MNKKITGRVINGKFKPDSPNDFKLSFASHEGQEVEIVVKRKSKDKVRQYRYLYGVVYQLIAEHTGYSTYYVDIMMKSKFCFDVVNGVKIPRKKSASTFKTAEFTQYIDNIRKWAMEFLEIRIPEPNEIDMEY